MNTNSPTVLFIGGTGVISTACTRLAAKLGFRVAVLNRGQRTSVDLPPGVETIVADVNGPIEDVQAALGKRTFDVVANFIAFKPEDVERDIKLFANRTSQYIFISSASAYEKPARGPIITERTPLVNPYWQYSRDKIDCENRLMKAHAEAKFPVTIVRPSLTYGDTLIPIVMNSWNKSWTIVDRLMRNKPVIVPGDGTTFWTTTHNTDFAKGFVGLLAKSAALGEAFHITSDEAITWDDHIRAAASAIGVAPAIVHAPSDLLIAHNPGLLGTLLGDKSWTAVFDNSKLRKIVPDYVATTTFAQGMKTTIAHMKATPELQEIDEPLNQWTDMIIGKVRRAMEA